MLFVRFTSAFLYSYESRASFDAEYCSGLKEEKKWDGYFGWLDYVERVGSFLYEHNSFISMLSLAINIGDCLKKRN